MWTASLQPCIRIFSNFFFVVHEQLVGCQKLVQYIHMLCPGWFILVESVYVIFTYSKPLSMKGQNIGSLTKTIYKQILDSDILDNKKQNYMSLRSFKSHTYCSTAKNGSVVVYQN